LVNQHVRFIESGEFLTYPKPTEGNPLDRLIERKQMSTKTTFKRVALVAVASLGFGVLTSVAPASAGESDAAEITAVAITAPGSGRVGSAFTSALGFTAAGSDIGDEVTIRGRFDSKPAGSTAVLAFNNVGLTVAGPSDETAFTQLLVRLEMNFIQPS